MFGALVISLAGCGGKEGAESEAVPSTGGAGDSPASGGTASGSGGAPARSGAPGSGGTVATGGAAPATGGAAMAPGGAPSDGDVSFVMDSFSVPPGGEYYKCQDFPNTFGRDIAILESHSSMTVGSHHLFVFRLTPDGFYGAPSNLGPNNTKGPLVDCPS